MLFEFHPRAIGVGEDSGESGAEEEHLYGIVDPNQDDDQGSSSPIGGTERCLSQVQTDSQLAEREEQRRYGCSEQNIAPVNLQVGKHLVDDGEQQGDDEEGHHRTADLQDRLRHRHPTIEKPARSRQ